jgi:hypothetical protein
MKSALCGFPHVGKGKCRATPFTLVQPALSLSSTSWPDTVLCLLRSSCLTASYMNLGVLGAAGAGFHPHLPGFGYNFLAKSLGATMWFFIFYRVRCVASTLGPARQHDANGRRAAARTAGRSCWCVHISVRCVRREGLTGSAVAAQLWSWPRPRRERRAWRASLALIAYTLLRMQHIDRLVPVSTKRRPQPFRYNMLFFHEDEREAVK